MAIEVVVPIGSLSPHAPLPPTPLTPENVAAHSHAGEAPHPGVELGGVLVDRTRPGGRGRANSDSFCRSGQPHQVVTVNLDFLSIAARNPDFGPRSTCRPGRSRRHATGLVSRLRGQPLPERVAGVEPGDRELPSGGRAGRGVFLLGAGPGVADAAGRRLQRCTPACGSLAPTRRHWPLRRRENDRIVRMIRAARPTSSLWRSAPPARTCGSASTSTSCRCRSRWVWVVYSTCWRAR